jgi:predicted helicase
MAILPYYIANLNIEFTYAQKMGKYEEFKNICLVDTLDHCGFEGKQFDLFAMSVQNTARIQNQNDRKISVIIGNPPYNANQENENDNNKNRVYESIDNRIKQTYIKESSAQKTKIYDPYTRFFRWASDRLDRNGVLVFITNSSFLEKRAFDGFRKSVSNEFHEIYIVDLGGDVRINPRISGTTHNVFGIQTGVTISFMVKKLGANNEVCKIFYARRPEFETADDKLKFITGNKINQILFDHINPDKKGNWLNLTSSNFEELIVLTDKSVKNSKTNEEAIFKLFSLGVVTNRDEWVYDFSRQNLTEKMRFFFKIYENELKTFFDSKNRKIKEFNADNLSQEIKWTRALKNQLKQGTKVVFEGEKILRTAYRPFTKKFLYYSKSANEM